MIIAESLLLFSIKTKIELKKGNPEAFKEVFLTLHPRLKGYCKLFVADGNVAEDLIQECFLTLWERKESIDPLRSVENLIFVMVRNRCLNELRKHRMEGERIGTENIQVAELQYLYQLDFTNKEDKSLEELLIESFQEAVNALPEKMKTVFTLCKIDGKNQKEVAETLGISIKMVEKHIAHAKQHIRERLLKQYPALILLISIILE